MKSSGLREPPEGVIRGESVPVENDQPDIEESLIDEYVGVLKTKEAYQGWSDSELREKARQKIEEIRNE